jgi:hypothetical protein
MYTKNGKARMRRKKFGGLMKKSFIGFSAALVLLLALVGCEQATDSDSDSGSSTPLPGW